MKQKKHIYIIMLLLVSLISFAQAPEKMSYQAVVRNATNSLVTNQVVGMKISILQGSASGTAVYAETQSPTSNINGLVTIEIGTGSVINGTFASIDWASGPYFIKTETDPTGGSAYTIVGTSQLLSSPYALYAKTAGSSTPGPQGPVGPAGPQGPAGPAGANGVDGATGPQGPIGLTGAIGATGPQGPTGATGPTGANGVDGATGPQGPIGLTGPAGATGATGAAGTNGLSSYQIAQNNGFSGTETQWLASLVGAQGPAGAQGPIGLTGPAGSNATVTGTAPIDVTSGMVSLNDDGVTTAKLANNSVTIAKLPSGATSSTYLRGDGTWVNPLPIKGLVNCAGTITQTIAEASVTATSSIYVSYEDATGDIINTSIKNRVVGTGFTVQFGALPSTAAKINYIIVE